MLELLLHISGGMKLRRHVEPLKKPIGARVNRVQYRLHGLSNGRGTGAYNKKLIMNAFTMNFIKQTWTDQYCYQLTLLGRMLITAYKFGEVDGITEGASRGSDRRLA